MDVQSLINLATKPGHPRLSFQTIALLALRQVLTNQNTLLANHMERYAKSKDTQIFLKRLDTFLTSGE